MIRTSLVTAVAVVAASAIPAAFAADIKLRIASGHPPGVVYAGLMKDYFQPELKKRVEANHGVPFTYDDDVVKLIVSRCNEVESGGRVVDAILTNTVLPRISREYLERLAAGKAISQVALRVEGQDFAYGFD